jgi:hypothetical protein
VLFLTGEVAGGLRQPRLELRLARLCAGFFAFQRIALDAQTVQHCRALGLRIA